MVPGCFLEGDGRIKKLVWRLPGVLQSPKPNVQAASSLRWIDKPSGFEASRRLWIDKGSSLEVARRHWIGKNNGLEASRKRWTEKTSSLEASRTLRDDLEGLTHYACSGFKASRRPDEAFKAHRDCRGWIL